MPPPLDPRGPQVPSLPEDAEPSAHANPLDPNPEASHFLDNLDMSAFEPCDFDFSSLMDLDHIDDAALLDIPDLDMNDMSMMPIGDSTVVDLPVLETSNFQDLTTLDPESTLTFDQTWLRDASGSTESGFPALGAPASFPSTSNVTDFLSPPLALNDMGLPENCHSWGHDGKTSQLPTASNSSNPIPTQHVAPGLSYCCETTPGLGDHGQGSPSFVSQPVTGPVIRDRGPLPPARRGGRRGRLTREQAERQLMARANGVCIRCRCVGITCEGGFPCKACLVLRKPRLWRSPCTKAQFLEIIESNSFFLRTSMLRHLLVGTLNIETAKVILAQFRSADFRLANIPISVDTLGKRCNLDLSFGFRGLTLLCFPGDFRKPSSERIREAERQLLQEYPSGMAVDFLWGPRRPGRFHWVYTLAFFSSGRRFSNYYEEEATRPIYPVPRPKISARAILKWFYRRYGELILFSHLQEMANNLSKVTEDQKTFIYSTLFILKHSVSERPVSFLDPTVNDGNIGREVEDHLDRQTRVRTALWIFASVFVSRLPAYTDFWNHLPQELDIFTCGTRKLFQKSLADLDTDALVSADAIFNEKRKLLSHLFFISDEHDDSLQETIEQQYTCCLWEDMLRNTPEGIREIERISVGPISSFTDVANVYEQNEAERFLVPKTREERDDTARRFFGGLLSMVESPIIQSMASLYQADGCVRPSSTYFMNWFSRFIHRIPGRCNYHNVEYKGLSAAGRDMTFRLWDAHETQTRLHGADVCIRSSQRWLQLASLLGDGAYLIGGGIRDVVRHPFLDVENIVEHGTEGEFSRLKRLLSHNGSWIRAACVELNGLVQALIQISETSQLSKMRAFQHLLDRKCQSAFGEIVLSTRWGKPGHTQQLLLENMKRHLLDLLPPVSEVKESRMWVRNAFELAILEGIEDASRGKEEPPPESDILAWICFPVFMIAPKFVLLYAKYILALLPGWEHATILGVERMTERLDEAMEKFLAWYIEEGIRSRKIKLRTREEVSEAFSRLIDLDS